MKIEEYLTIKCNNDDKFFDCMHGYIYAIPEHNVYQNKCNIQEECYCINCPNFVPKKTNSGTYIQCHTCRKYFNVEKMNFSNRHWFCNSCYGVDR